MEPRKLVIFMVILLSSHKETKSLEENSLDRTEFTYNHYRLPTSVRPENYKLRILTFLEDPSDLRFEGEVLIKLQVLEDTKNITLHSWNLDIDESQIKIKRLQGNRNEIDSGEKNCIKAVATNDRFHYLIMQLCNVAKKGEEYSLAIPFKGILSKNSKGYYRNSYETGNVTRWLAVTQFETIHARSAFPCFDEPALKATFTISLGHHKQYTALSNMPLKDRKPMSSKPDWVWSEFEESVPMSTYLVAYTVNDFSYVASDSTLHNEVQFRAWSRPNEIHKCDYASTISPKVLKFYENTFELKFPLPKIDQIAVLTHVGGAMENWGLVTYHEGRFHYDESVHDPDRRKKQVAETVAHELTHQWFGNIVTMEWWSNLWLNEGFAKYISGWGTKYLHPEWSDPVPNPLDDWKIVQIYDALKSSKPLSWKIEEIDDILSAFNPERLVYPKGSLIVKMMNDFLGNETFLGGLKLYLKNHLYQNVKQDDLWEALNEVAQSTGALSNKYSIKTIMDSWTLQAGFPLIRAKRDNKTGTVTITQERYLESGQDEDKNSCWWVPLTYTTGKEVDSNMTTPKDWLECDADNVPIVKELTDIFENECNYFVIERTGLFRVSYDRRNWDMIIETLTGENYQSIDVINRAQIVNDVMALARSRHEDYDLVFRLIPYIRQEKEYLPWKSALDSLSDIDYRFYHSSSDYESFKSYMVYILKPIYTYLNEKKEIDSINEFKELINNWACKYKVVDCKERSLKYFKRWRTETDPDTQNPIPKDLRTNVYCTAIRYGHENEYNFLKERLLHTNSEEEKQRIFEALGCPQETQLLERSLDWAIHEDDLKYKKYFKFLLESIATNEIGFRLVKDFFMKNIQSIYELYSSDARGFSELLQSIADRINNQSDYEALKVFLEENKNIFDKIEMDATRALETAAIQVDWKEHSYEDFMQNLRRSLLRTNE